MPRSPHLYWISSFLLCGSYFALRDLGELYLLVSVALIFGVIFYRPLSSQLIWSLVFCGLGYWNGTLYVTDLPETNGTCQELVLEEVLKPTERWWRYYGRCAQTEEQLLVNIRRGTLQPAVGSTVLTQKNPWAIQHPSMPATFDYAHYLKQKKIYRQYYLSKGEFTLVLGEELDNFSAARLKEKLHNKLQQQGFSSLSSGLILALSMGSRNYLDQHLRTDFAQTGLMHLLALSGLHIGLLFIFLNQLLQPLLRMKHGKKIRALLVLICLWGFCALSGGAASTTRAVLMLSIWQLSFFLHRKTPAMGILASSAFLLVLFRPVYVVEMGFQLSFLAVASILIVAPWAQQLSTHWPSALQKLWGWVWVCLAAQLGVAPLSIHHFHQFPGLFLIANITVFPIFCVYLACVFGTVAWVGIGTIPNLLVHGLNTFTDFLSQWVAWLAEQEQWLLDDVRLSAAELLCCYLILIGTVVLLKYKKWLSVTVVLLLGILVLRQGTLDGTTAPKAIWMGDLNNSYLGIQKGPNLKLYGTANNKLTETQKKNLWYRFGIKQFSVSKKSTWIPLNGKQIYHQTDTLLPKRPESSPAILWMSKGPRIDFEALLDSLCPLQLWIDKTNPAWLILHWKHTAHERAIEVVDMSTDGFKVIPL
ncbi:MAG: ComEC/Rec2 family competence protein [Flavobacteriaceae bacterium]